jgi:quercetin dioxygenase-like cupin family protein
MKKFFAGVLVGVLAFALGVPAQQAGGKKIVQPEKLHENDKVEVVRWVLKPGEGTPAHTHTLDHVAVVVQGSTLRDTETDGTYKDVEQKTGQFVYVPGTGRTHTFSNAGQTTLEIVSIELKK